METSGVMRQQPQRHPRFPLPVLPELFRDTRFVILDKPAGLPVHAGPRGGASVEDAFPALTRKPHGPWLAHRLDADTSGCLAIALTKTALIAAQATFAAGTVRKTYWALVHGAPGTPEGTVDAPLRKHTSRTGWRMAIDPAGDPAISDWTVLATGASLSLLEIRPRTGRTHQVRVHCASLGCPIAGDPIYGNNHGTLALLSRALALPLTPPAAATAPVPPHMRALMHADPVLASLLVNQPDPPARKAS
jgi:tRNA pseudouridine32 synthase/23S rRNA pseudouridine746 synthase